MRRPARCLKPLAIWKEERLRQDATPDDKISPFLRCRPPVARNPCSHLRQGVCTVCFSKRLPGQRARQCIRMHENTAANDDAVRSVQSEQEHLPSGERPEGTTRGSPEVHFRKVGLSPEVLKPLRVCQGDNKSDGHPCPQFFLLQRESPRILLERVGRATPIPASPRQNNFLAFARWKFERRAIGITVFPITWPMYTGSNQQEQS